MLCPRCGQQAPENAAFCPGCGNPVGASPPGNGQPLQPLPYGRHQEHIPNYLVFSILVTLFCCLPSGIVAIVYAAQVNAKQAAGDITGAMVASNTARAWCWMSLGLALAGMLIYFIGLVLLVSGGAFSLP